MQIQSQSIFQQVQNDSISIYKDELTTIEVINQFKKLKLSFPQLSEGFYDILSDRIKKNGFTDKRLKDAIDNLIDNYIYPLPSIASIISFDKRIKLLTYYQMCDLAYHFGKSVWCNYKVIKTNAKQRMYASITDIELYHLEIMGSK